MSEPLPSMSSGEAGEKRTEPSKAARSTKKRKRFPEEEPDFLSKLKNSQNKAKTFQGLLDRVTSSGCGNTVITISVRDASPLEYDSDSDYHEPPPPQETRTAAVIIRDMCVADDKGVGASVYKLLGRGSERDSAENVANAVKYLQVAYATTKRNIARVDDRKETQRLEDEQRELKERLEAVTAALAARKRRRSDKPPREAGPSIAAGAAAAQPTE